MTLNPARNSRGAVEVTPWVEKYIMGKCGAEGLENFPSAYDFTGSYKIGYGKHSDVISARSKRSGMERAVKVLSLTNIGDAKIHKEVIAMHMFSHQRCSQMKDVLLCREQLPNVRAAPPYVCIVMEHIRDAETLSQVVLRGGDPQLATKIVAQIGGALAEMHACRLLHKDLWPENILIDKAGNAWLIDFGCAESQDGQSGPQNDVNIPYASPQICKREAPSPGDDNWALGLVLTETVTGKVVSHRMNHQQDKPLFFEKHLLEEAISETYSKGGPILGQIVRQLLDMNAAQRATAPQVVAALGQQSSLSQSYSPAVQTVPQTLSPAPQASLQAWPPIAQTLPQTLSTVPFASPQRFSPAPQASMVGSSPMFPSRTLPTGQNAMSAYQANGYQTPYSGLVAGRTSALQVQPAQGISGNMNMGGGWRLSSYF